MDQKNIKEIDDDKFSEGGSDSESSDEDFNVSPNPTPTSS